MIFLIGNWSLYSNAYKITISKYLTEQWCKKLKILRDWSVLMSFYKIGVQFKAQLLTEQSWLTVSYSIEKFITVGYLMFLINYLQLEFFIAIHESF